ncbi:MAG: hypothetical protein L3J56_04655 [Bacteroidales bacterium]|nr:hypothetical protein [Bacteroidales bacterium]
MKNLIQILFFSGIIFIGSFGCKQPEKAAPLLPPEKFLSIDFSYFTTPENETGFYAHAFNTTLSWTGLLNDSLQLYKNLLNVISEKNLVYQDNDTWLISDSYYSGENQYDINYFEILNADTVETKLFFTLDSTYTNLLLFDGHFFPKTTVGYRQINKPDTGNTAVKFLRIDWSVISESQKYLKFTNLLSNNKNGDFIIYKDSSDSQYTTFFDLFDKASDNHTVIEYNKTNSTGRIKDKDYFGDDAWHCWDEQKQDLVRSRT